MDKDPFFCEGAVFRIGATAFRPATKGTIRPATKGTIRPAAKGTRYHKIVEHDFIRSRKS